ncbi:MAG: hypothetical protein AB1429_15320 [Pseudomonadota bacterium]|jgi:hypothetical protein
MSLAAIRNDGATGEETAALDLARHLREFETQLELAQIGGSELMAAMVQARQEVGAAFGLGQDALSKLAETIAALAEARAKVVRTHKALEQTRRDLGLDHLAFGDWDKG